VGDAHELLDGHATRHEGEEHAHGTHVGRRVLLVVAAGQRHEHAGGHERPQHPDVDVDPVGQLTERERGVVVAAPATARRGRAGYGRARADQMADHPQRIALLLQVADLTKPRQVPIVVVGDPALMARRGEQALGLVRPQHLDRHSGLGGQLVDPVHAHPSSNLYTRI
jgi:hypothetical protein